MTHKQRWQALSAGLYVIFIIVMIFTGLINPSKIGLPWTIFWIVAVALFLAYFYIKNWVYAAVVYYAKALSLSQDDLREMVTKMKKTEDVPNPARPGWLSPLVQVPLRVLNELQPQLETQAKEAGIPLYD